MAEELVRAGSALGSGLIFDLVQSKVGEGDVLVKAGIATAVGALGYFGALALRGTAATAAQGVMDSGAAILGELAGQYLRTKLAKKTTTSYYPGYYPSYSEAYPSEVYAAPASGSGVSVLEI